MGCETHLGSVDTVRGVSNGGGGPELDLSVLICPFGAEKTMTATDVTGFNAIFSTGFFATFSRF